MKPCCLCLAVLLGVLPALVWSANPSSENPDELLAVREQPASQELVLQAGVLVRDVKDELARYEDNLSTGKYKAGDSRELKTIGLTANKITHIDRFASRLIHLGEPAGADLKLRAREFRERHGAVVNAYRKLPNSPELIGNSAVQVQNISKTRSRTVPRLAELFKQGKVEQAEKGLNDIFDELEPLTVWHTARVYSAAYQPFGSAKKVIDAKANELRAAAGQQVLDELRQAEDPAFDATLAEVQRSLEAIKSSGKAMWQGTELDGPALLLAWGQAWRSAQAKTLRCRAIDWALGLKTGVRPPSEIDKLEAAYVQFDEKMVAAVGQLIAADAGRAIPEAVPMLYSQYLDAVATLTLQVASAKWLPTVEAALAGLRDKSPLVAQQVSAYEQATADVLRWRKRASAAAAMVRAKETPALAEVWKKASSPAAVIDRKQSNAKTDLMYLTTGAPALVRDVARVNLKQAAVVENLAPAADDAASSRYRDRLSASVASARIPEAELAQLRKDLLVTPSDPPLTLAAALALKSAEAGYLQAAGGEITGLHLESLLVHFIMLAADAPHIALGPFPPDALPYGAGDPVEQVTYWYELQPKWLQHEYIFVELP